ncbi:helix-turn-helix domain-containing protein [Dyella amyloliquefaciens]|uniref:helix-turn-helix domain-containing protein n=1 Tax=Dyella amyloliquefaciens TaxID=1770545 RepID=UPI00102E78AB|nr:XRE family transcriptional regulator [Dyella amyloliquefaciens]
MLKHLHAKPEPGSALRNLRKHKQLTLAEVSERTGLPVSTLSKIENGKMSLSYDKLARLSTGLEVDIAQLFEPDSAAPPTRVQGRRSITRAGSGLSVETENYSHLYPNADLLNKRLVPIIAEPHARSLAEFGELIRHEGEEFIYVLEGTVDLHTDLYAPTRLEAGDSMYFDSGMGHAYIAVGPKRCRVLSICTASQSRLAEALGSNKGTQGPPIKRKPRQPASTKKPVIPAKKRPAARSK